jgi:pimeloyl-ACP methyl ester carboxylesterase
MPQVHHRTATVQGREVFYREAGSPDAPHVVLLHGTPASSFMFRELIPLLADRFHVIAPDYIGFGLSDSPPVTEFDYTFDALADVTEELLEQLGVDHYAIYVQDYGAPVGWRLALRGEQQNRVSAIVSQNGNAYEDGFVDAFWAPLWSYAANPTPEAEASLREALNGVLSLETIRWQYTHGVPDPTVVSPDTWLHDYAMVHRPGNMEVQLKLFSDYPTNRELYPKLHEYLRRTQVPVLAIWGANDQIFGPEGAKAFARDLPDAEIELLDAGHFALESDLDTIAERMRAFLGRTVGVAA